MPAFVFPFYAEGGADHKTGAMTLLLLYARETPIAAGRITRHKTGGVTQEIHKPITGRKPLKTAGMIQPYYLYFSCFYGKIYTRELISA